MNIGILTSGGDTPGMNAVIRGVYYGLKEIGDFHLLGFKDGWRGLIENDYIELTEERVRDILGEGGTILGSGRTNPFKREGAVEAIKNTVTTHGLEAVIAIGGEDTLGVANKLHQEGLPMIGVPKTIDNDLDATDYTFGFYTAVQRVSDAIDMIKTTARSHHRVIVVEIMGRHAGWITLFGGIAGGAHVILIPEKEIDIDEVVRIVERQYKNGDNYAIIAVAEGCILPGIDQDAEKDEFGHVRLEKLAIGKRLAEEIKKRTSREVRDVVLGHLQRGGSPVAFDRVLSTRLGLKASELVKNRQYGMMASLQGLNIVAKPLQEAVANLRTVPDDILNEFNPLFSH